MSSTRTLRSAKQALRKELKKHLKSMSSEERSKQSQTVFNKLISTDAFRDSKSLSLYMSMPGEVETNELMKYCFQFGKKCFIPHYKGDLMKMVLLENQADYDSLPLTAWNIKQPADDDVRHDAMNEDGGLDVIIVPGLGFTRDGLRLGRGRGYYDNYFRKYEEKFKKRPLLVGLSYTCQIVEDLPADEFDIRLDQVLYP